MRTRQELKMTRMVCSSLLRTCEGDHITLSLLSVFPHAQNQSGTKFPGCERCGELSDEPGPCSCKLECGTSLRLLNLAHLERQADRECSKTIRANCCSLCRRMQWLTYAGNDREHSRLVNASSQSCSCCNSFVLLLARAGGNVPDYMSNAGAILLRKA